MSNDIQKSVYAAGIIIYRWSNEQHKQTLEVEVEISLVIFDF
jgi:hypothetical protein